jgi:uncharacterized protein YlxP (DUF503 family)
MLPKKFDKMTIAEQELYIVKKLSELYVKESVLRKALAKVRGKHKIDFSEIERPDLLELKGETN